MDKNDEGVHSTTSTDESGKPVTEQLARELDKERAIKEKLVAEQIEKNRKHRSLKEERMRLEQQYNELKTQFDALSSQFSSASKDLAEAKAFREQVEGNKKAELQSILLSVPEERKTLIPTGMSVEDQLKYIKTNWQHIFGGASTSRQMLPDLVNAFNVTVPARENLGNVSLSPEEKRLTARFLSEEAALELKARNPKIFEQFLKK